MGEKIIKNGWWGKSEIIIRCREDDYIDKERRKGVKMDFKNVKGRVRMEKKVMWKIGLM